MKKNTNLPGKELLLLFILSVFITCNLNRSYGQCEPCEEDVVTVEVDLSDSVDIVWDTTDIVRNNHCCGAVGSTRCIRFDVTTHELTEQIKFEVINPSPPGGAFYQIDCGEHHSLADSVCVSDMTTFCIVYCKSGGDSPTYRITAGRSTHASDDITLNAGCTDMMYAQGMQESTVTWTSVYPGAEGAYNSYLSCTSQCDTTYVTAPNPLPGIEYVDYVVSATAVGCSSGTSTDTVRVYFVESTLDVAIDPAEPAICFGSAGVGLTANGTGGAPPYAYEWSTGETTQSIFAGAIGEYSVTVTDTTNCSGVPDTVNVVEFDSPISCDAGEDQAVCADDPAVTLDGSVVEASGGTWSGGAGEYVPNEDDLNAEYTPSAAEIAAGTVTLTLTTTGNLGCPASTDEMTITIAETPTANAGADATICAGSTHTLAGAFGGSATGITWTTSGTGTFDDDTQTDATYTPSAADITAGSVTLTITTDDPGGDCDAASDQMVLTIDEAATADAGDDATICSGSTHQLSGGFGGSATSITWTTSGSGTFDDDTQTDATYTPSAADITAGSVTLTITTDNPAGPCGPASDDIVLTIDPVATADAGDDATVCAGTTHTLAGGFGGSATSITWTTSGSGTFDDDTQTDATYTPSAADITAGSVTLTITTDDPAGPCGTATDDMVLTIDPSATADAGDDATICEGSTHQLAGGFGGSATSITWTTSGSGTFDDDTQTDATYTPSAADITAGSVTLTITTDDPAGPCGPATDDMVLTIDPAATADAGDDATICAGSTHTLAGGFGGGASTITWTTSGSGTFDNDTQTDATYTPSAADITAGSVTLTITTDDPAGPCGAASDNMVLTINAAATADAGDDATICAGSTHQLDGGFGGSATGITWSSSGSGTFNDNSLTDAVYTPSGADITAGSVILTITTDDPAGPCGAVSDNMTLTINPVATADAGDNATICAGSTHTLAGGFGGSASTITWTTSGSGTFDDDTQTDATYTPSAADIVAGTVILTITTDDPAGPCGAVSDNMTLTINPVATADAGADATICEGSTYTLGGAIGGSASTLTWTTSGTGTFDDDTQTDATYTPSAADITAGSVVLTITTDDPAGPCGQVSDNMTLTINPAATADAGDDATICAGSTHQLSGGYGGGATSITWSTSGTGTFDDDNQTDATYTPSAADITAGSVVLTITTNNPAGPCNAVSDNMTLTINPVATADAGADATICEGSTYTLGGAIGGSASTLTWTTSGTGTFDDDTQTDATYTPSAADITAGSVTLTITTDDPAGPCGPASDDMVLTINDGAEVSAGDDATICEGSTHTLSGTMGGSAALTTWTTSGTGTFDNAGLLAATYTPSAADIAAGSVTLTITTDDPAGPCGAVSDNMTLTINPVATADAGANATICEGSTYTLGGAIGGSASTLTWTTSGTGTFDDDTQADATYTPSAADITAGSVTLTITTDDPAGPCGEVSDNMTLTINPGPTASAGDDATICEGSTYTLSGAIGGSASTLTWTTSGTGTFDDDTQTDATYTPSAADEAAGSITLTITTDDPAGPCGATSDDMVLTINPAATANAGANATICEGSTYTLGGAIGGSASTLTWTTSGTGTFNDDTQSDATYTPSAADITAGSVVLTITTDDPAGPCGQVSDNMTLTINPGATTSAGDDATICVGSTHTLAGAFGGSATSIVWSTSGTGAFDDDTQTDAVYTPSAADEAAGSVTLTITTDDPAGPCGSVSDDMALTINPEPTADAGADATICSGSTYTLAGGFGGAATSISWSTSGSGTFDDNTQTDATYTPSAADITAGSVTLTITTDDPAGPCISASDNMVITIDPVPTAEAGDNATICVNGTYTLSGAFGGSASGITWTTAGSGTFNDDSNPAATYTPSAADEAAGSVILTITTDDPAGPCVAVSDNMPLTINPDPTADAGDDATICEGSTHTLAGGFGGAASSITWSSSGSGTFDDNTQTDATYTPSAADITAGSVILTITTDDPAGPCDAVFDNMTLTIDPVPTVSAGADATICIGSTHTLSGAFGGAASSITWTTDGTGTFDDDTQTDATYTPSAADEALGTVTLTITSDDPAGPCGQVTDDMVLTINEEATADAGDDAIICEGETHTLAGGYGGAASSISWTTSGTGTFDDNTQTDATYTPSAADITAGSVNLTITTNDPAGPCTAGSDLMVLTITAKDDPSFAYGSGTYCQTGADPTPVITGTPGGTFSEPTGNIVFISALTGQIDVSASTVGGPYTITYTTAGVCPDNNSTGIAITLAPDATFSYNGPYCTDGVDPLPTFVPLASAGTFSAVPAGLVFVDVNTGEIDLDASTPGNYMVTNDIPAAGGCAAASDTEPVTIENGATANAGADDATCTGDTYTLGGAIGGSATTLTWTTAGTGTFDDDTQADAEYTPSADDITAGSVVLTITTNDPAGSCNAVSDDMTLTIDPVPTVEAGDNATICAGSTHTLSGSYGGTASSITWSTDGTGTFNDNTSTSATYTPSGDDITAGSVILTIESDDPAGPCGSVTDNMTLTINPVATASAGGDATICSGDTYTLAGVIGGGASTLTWTTTGTGTFDDNTQADATYTPSAADITLGTVTLTITTDDPAGQCNAVSDNMVLTIDPAATVSAGSDATICSGSTHTLSGAYGGAASSITWSTDGNGLFDDDTQTDATYTPSADDIAAGTVTLTITSDDPAGPCGIVTDDMVLTIDPVPTADAGDDATICSDGSHTLAGVFGGSASSVTWTSSGTGTFDDNTLTDASYTPSAADIAAGSVILTMTTDNPAGPCNAVSDDMTLTIEPAATADAGSNATICAGETHTLSGAFGGSATSITWTSDGTGLFDDDTQTDATYTPSADDITAGSVTLTITTDDPAGNCIAASDDMILTINPLPTVSAGDDATICEGETYTLSGVMGGSASSIVWSSPTAGTFDDAGSLTATYTPSADDITAGTVTLTITTNDPAGPCTSVSDDMVLTIDPVATVNAGSDAGICIGSTYTLSGAFGGGASSITWSTSGTGLFDDDTQTDATYTPSAADEALGTVTLTITSDDPAGPCGQVTDDMVLTINESATATAGDDDAVCESESYTLSGAFGGAASSITWSTSGSGTFDDDTQTDATYTPSAADITAGTVTLTITTNDPAGACIAASDDMVLTIETDATVTAGDDATICEGSSYLLSGVMGGGASSVIWTSTTGGTFDDAGLEAATYTPSAEDIAAGSVTLTITTDDPVGSCSAATDDMVLTIDQAATVSAGDDATVCEGETYSLSGVMGGSATLVTWTSPTAGTFDDAGSLTATYTPCAADITAGSVTLTITTNDPAGPCLAATDDMVLTIDPAAVISAGDDATICEGETQILSGSLGGGASTVVWTTSGSGMFDDNTLVDAEYTPSADDISAGSVTLTITSDDPAGPCAEVTDDMTLTINPAATVEAGEDATICEGESYTLSGSMGGGASSITWTSPTAGTFDDETLTDATYTPSAADIAAGIVTLTITTNDPAGPCGAASDDMVITIEPAATVDAGVDATICEGDTYTLSGVFGGSATGITWSTDGTGTFDNADLPAATYTPSADDIDAGSVTLTITTDDPAGSCNAVSDDMLLVINPAPIVDAGADSAICEGDNYTLAGSLGGGASGITWTSPTGGTFDDPNLLTATYTLSAADITAGSVVLTITSDDPAGPCIAVSDDMTLTINPLPTVDAGSDATICEGETYTFTDAAFGGGATSVTWSSPTGGTFDDANLLLATYTPSAEDIAAGSVILTITTDDPAGSCIAESDNMTLTIDPAAVVDAGPDTAVCEGETHTISGASVSGGATTITWSSPSGGTFDDETLLTATYTPSAADITAGSVVLTITTDDPAGPCGSVFDTFTLTIEPIPTVEAGPDTTICPEDTYTIEGASFGGGATGITWSSPTAGTFDDPNLVDATYTPCAEDIAAGEVTLTITTDNPIGACEAAVDSMKITIIEPAVVDAGDDQEVCLNNTEVSLNGSVTGGTTTGLWETLGTGTFDPDASTLDATYDPSAADTTAGSVILVLQSADFGDCDMVTDTMTITFSPAPLVLAGDDQTVCANDAVVSLAGSVSGGSVTGTWTTDGTGTFAPSQDSMNVTYTPSDADTTAGTVNLVLTSTNNGGCIAEDDTVVLTITPAPFVDAGPDQVICADNAEIILDGTIYGGSTTGVWTSDGTGYFSPDSATIDASYFPSDEDTANHFVTLVLTSTNNGQCIEVTDTMTITIDVGIVVDAGDDQTVCANDPNITLDGSISGGTITGEWTTNGTGSFDPDATTLDAVYEPSAADTVAGSVILVLTSTNNGLCNPVTDTLILTISEGIHLEAGPDQTVCANNSNVQLDGSVWGGTVTGEWSSSGTGIFAPDAGTLDAVYLPGTEDLSSGTVTLTLASTNNGLCLAVYDSLEVTITPAPVADAGPDQWVCVNIPDAVMDGSVTGGAVTGQWSSSGTGSFTPDDISMNATYVPSPEDTVSGSVTIVLTSTNNGDCNAVTDTMIVYYTAAPQADAGEDQEVCANNFVTLDGIATGGAGTGTWTTTGSGTFDPDPDSLNADYHFSEADTTTGTVTFYLTTTNTGGCLEETDTMVVTITPAPYVEAGEDISVCANNDTVYLAGIISGPTTTGIWSTSGSGVFNPNDSTLNALYLPADTDTALGTFPIYLTSTNNGDCFAESDSLMLTITIPPEADAGPDQSVCNGFDVELDGEITGGQGTGQWATSGTGTFSPDADSLDAVYTPSVADTTAGTVSLILMSTNNGNCLPAYDTMIVTLTTLPYIDAGIDQTVCANNPDVILNGIVSGSTTTGQWSSGGTGTFTPDDTTLNATYIPGDEDTTAGSVLLILTATNACPATDTLEVTITPAPMVDAGANQDICIDEDSVSLQGIVSGGATTGIWTTTGTGIFLPDAESLNAIYIRSEEDSIAGSVTIILTSTNYGNCLEESDSMVITMSELPVVDAGVDYTYCSNNADIQLQGSVSGESSTGYWETLGSGTFDPDQDQLDAFYYPSPEDTAAGSVTLILTSTNTCVEIKDTVVYTLTPSPFVDAGEDISVCANNTDVSLNGIVGGATSTGEWFTTGNGIFLPNEEFLNADYSVTEEDIEEGTIYLTLVSTNNGMCFPVKDTLVLTITPEPVVDAGEDQYICTDESVVLNGSVSEATTTGAWQTTGTGTFSPSDTALNGTYIPSPADTALGSVTLILTSTNNGNCNSVTDMMQVTITPTPLVSAGADVIVCANNPDVDLNGSVSGSSTTGLWETSGTGTFAPSDTSLNATYTPGTEDMDAGEVTLVLSSTYACLQTDTLIVTITPSPAVDAGEDQYYCDEDPIVTLFGTVSGGSTTGVWTTTGTGTFSPNDTTLDAIYYPSAQDTTIGSITFTLTSTNNGDCIEGSDEMTVNFVPVPTVIAGDDQIVCANNYVGLYGTIFGGSSTGEWTTDGTGIFWPGTTYLETEYVFSDLDTTLNELMFILTSDEYGSCLAKSDTMIVTITPAPWVDAGPDDTVCENNDWVSLNGNVWGATSTGQWTTTGTGSFMPSDVSLSTNYLPSDSDAVAGFVQLILTTTNNGDCFAETDTVNVTIIPAPVVDAGDDQYICTDENIYLNGSITGITTTGIWESDGSGTFTPDETTLDATYIPSAADTVNGIVTFILTSTDNGLCIASIDTMVVTITPRPVVDAGEDQIACANNSDILLNGSVSGSSTTGVWSTDGTGIFIPDSATLDATYVPGAEDTAAGIVTLILASTNACEMTDTIVVTITPAPVADAGPDQYICLDEVYVYLDGSVTGGASTGIWTTSGTGTFVPNDSTLNAVYARSAEDSIAGEITLVLTSTNNGSCLPENDSMKVTITTVPDVFAGDDQIVCATNNVNLNGIITGGSGTGEWTCTGTGSFVPDNTELDAQYILSAGDTTAGSVTFILTSTQACMDVTDTMVVTITDAPQINGWTDEIICDNDIDVNIYGTVTVANEVIWSSLSDGSFDQADSLNTTYIFSDDDIVNQQAVLILTAVDVGDCEEVSDTLVINMTPGPVVDAGPDQSLCFDELGVYLQGSVTEGATTGIWTTTGSGSFAPNDSSLSVLYVPTLQDTATGSLMMVLTSTNNGTCFPESDTMYIHWGDKPTLNAGQDTVICSNMPSIDLTGTIIGNGTIQWYSTGTGVFSPDDTSLITTYIFSADDYLSDSLYFIIGSEDGCEPAYDTLGVNMEPAPVAGFGYSTECNSLSVTFTDQSTITEGAIVDWYWIFGDGTSSTESDPEKVYDTAATYTVQLIVTTDMGCMDTVAYNVPLIMAEADFASSGNCVGINVNFTDNSVVVNDSVESWSWDFGDGNTSAAQNPSNMYDAAGTYTVELIITTTGGCIDTAYSEVSVTSFDAYFTYTGNCADDTVLFADSSIVENDSIVIWDWDFGDGYYDTVSDPEHAYIAAGDYDVILIAQTSNGCLDTISQTITISPNPVAGFTPDKYEINQDEVVTFTDNSVGATEWYWDFGDEAGTSEEQSPSYSYHVVGGTYTVTQIVTNEYGCVDTARVDLSLSDVLLPVIPTAFSPNGDGKNDVLHVLGGPFVSLELKIYNNWGLLIFETNDQQIGWDGTKNGKKQPIGVYVYTAVIVTMDNVTHEVWGEVTLLR